MIKSIFIDKKFILYVYLRRVKQKLYLEKYEIKEIESEEFLQQAISRNHKNFLAYTFQNIENVKVEIPSVKDEKTREFLIKSQLKSQNISVDKFKIYYTLESKEETKETYSVYLFPLSVFENLELDEEKKVSLEIFTFPIFSLSYIYKAIEIFNNKYVLHIHLTKYELILVLSTNGKLVYFRTVEIPDYISTEDQVINFVYENVNLTYIYIRQSVNDNVDIVTLSGDIAFYERLAEQVYSFMGSPIVSIIPYGFIENCDGITFQHFIINFGTLNVDRLVADLRPEKYIYKRNFVKLSRKLFYFSLSLFFVTLFFLAKEYKDLNEKQNEITLLKNEIREQLRNKLSKSKFSYEEFEYFIKYLNLIKESQTKNAIVPLEKTIPLLKVLQVNNISSTIDDEKFIIKIIDNLMFSSLIEFNDFKNSFERAIEIVKKKGLIVRNNSQYNINTLNVEINLTIEGKL